MQLQPYDNAGGERTGHFRPVGSYVLADCKQRLGRNRGWSLLRPGQHALPVRAPVGQGRRAHHGAHGHETVVLVSRVVRSHAVVGWHWRAAPTGLSEHLGPAADSGAGSLQGHPAGRRATFGDASGFGDGRLSVTPDTLRAGSMSRLEAVLVTL